MNHIRLASLVLQLNITSHCDLWMIPEKQIMRYDECLVQQIPNKRITEGNNDLWRRATIQIPKDGV